MIEYLFSRYFKHLPFSNVHCQHNVCLWSFKEQHHLFVLDPKGNEANMKYGMDRLQSKRCNEKKKHL